MRAFIAFLFILLAGCSSKDLPEYTQLGGLRVLALIANTPEVSPGDTVTITPVVSDILGAGRTLTYSATGCSDPGIAYGGVPTCVGAMDAVSLATGTVTPATPRFTESAPTFSVTIPATALALRGETEKYNGVPYLVTYTLSASTGERVRAFRRILVSTKTSKNQNPGAFTLTRDGAEMLTLPASAVTVTRQIASGSAETYSYRDANGTLQTLGETLTTTWFVSDGSFSRYRTDGDEALTFTPPTAIPATHAVVIVLIVRDDRGGSGFKIYGY